MEFKFQFLPTDVEHSALLQTVAVTLYSADLVFFLIYRSCKHVYDLW